MKIRFGCYLIAALLSAVPGRASLIVTVGSVSAGIGSTGNALDVMLTNTGAGPVTFGGFNFTISTLDTDITFTSTNISTLQPYIFAGDSLFGPTINLSAPGQTMDGSDNAVSLSGDAVGAGATVGLGHVLFDVSPTAALGNFAVTLASFPGTSLSDPTGGNIPINTLTNGSITIATPEPGSLLFLGGGLAAVILAKRRASRRVY